MIGENAVMDLLCCALGATLSSGLLNTLQGLTKFPQSRPLLCHAASSGRPDVVRWLLKHWKQAGTIENGVKTIKISIKPLKRSMKSSKTWCFPKLLELRRPPEGPAGPLHCAAHRVLNGS